MRVTLVYNATSGGAAPEADIVAELHGAGWHVERRLSRKEADDCLDYDADVVVVAGGDGTVGRVTKRLAGTGVAMAIVPMGTANNVARSLGIGVDPLAAAQGLACPVERRVDLGAMSSRRAKGYFVEGFGVGLFAHVVAERASHEDKELPRALGLLADELEAHVPGHFDLEVDGRDCSGRYVLAAIMNARSFGPALGVAPKARCDDGELDVVLVRPEARRHLAAHLREPRLAHDALLPAFETTRARRVHVRADGRWAHIDDCAYRLDGETTIDVAAGAVKMLVPSNAKREAARCG